MKKTIVSLICTLALCLGLLPTAALAAGEGAPDMLYVGNQSVRNGDNTTYWTTDDSGALTQSNESAAWNVKYDPATATLTLNGATITGNSEYASASKGAGIYALSRSGQPVSLTIELIGENTITGIYGIYVNSELSENSYGTDASLTITGESNGSLKVSGSYHGIYVKSGTGGASLNINDASVVASCSSSYDGYAGVCVQSSSDATSSPKLSLAVDGGSLTTSASEGNDGIQFYVGSSQATGATTSLTISNNAIVRAQNGIKASRVDEPTPSGTGIVFDGTEGTVYGNVTLDESLTIAQGETLTIPQGSTLNVNSNLTNNGTVTIENGGTLTGGDAINNTDGTINVENGGILTGKPTTGTVVNAPAITTQPESKTVTVGQTATFTVAADGTSPTYQWQQKTTDSGATWTDISGATSATYTTAATELDMSGYQYRCVVSNTAGTVTSAPATLTVTQPVTGVKLDKDTLSLVVDGTATLQATVAPENATNKDVTWTSDKPEIAKVENGKVTALKQGTATITVTTNDGGKTATCTVNVTAKTYQIAVDKSTLDFGSMFAGNSVPGAQTVTVKNTGNQTVTLNLPASTYYNVTAGTGFTNGNAVIEPEKTATFTVQPKTGLAAGTWQETLTVSGDNGVQAALLCKLTVTAKTYSLSIDPGAIGFGNVQVGYNQPAVKEVVVKNTGNQTLTLTQPTATNYQVGSLNQFTVAPGDTAVFTVQPKAGLLAGSYNETVLVAANGGAGAVKFHGE